MNFDGNQQFMVKIIPDGSLGAAWRRRWALFGTLRLTIDKCVLSLIGAQSVVNATTVADGCAVEAVLRLRPADVSSRWIASLRGLYKTQEV